MQLIQAKTCIKFQAHTDEENYVSIAYRQGRCASNVGMQGGEQTVALDPRLCMGLGQVVHEFLHALGFFHEHSRPDRDEYVDVVWDNIVEVDSCRPPCLTGRNSTPLPPPPASPPMVCPGVQPLRETEIFSFADEKDAKA
ncbi:hypothetical protein HPB52_012049 [Rhipicephalus sanguineus]|uniref:Metalloendopeptidase n=1 Tax=Rhipicephalus sanguineus TaxID=34632 RepID=A0A9D4T9Q4_RHISA|nr:hypothetical protein HPB52_012049 [Rhipicephalus sanguineus]